MDIEVIWPRRQQKIRKIRNYLGRVSVSEGYDARQLTKTFQTGP
jgi:hypothetical protein